MATYTYKPYYVYSGPARSQPFRKELTAEEIEKNLAFFFNNLDSHFVGTDAVVRRTDADTVSVQTTHPEDKCDEILKGLLDHLDLFAHKTRGP